MKIGLDIDNVISAFNKKLLTEFLKEDKNKRNKGIINPNADYITKGMFDWSQEETETFYKSNIERIAKELDIIENAEKYINKLKENGYKIYIISGRDNKEYSNPYKITSDWLNKFNIKYNELILTNSYDSHEKTQVCIEKNIDIMIDDSVRICKDLKEYGINVLLMDTDYNKYCTDIKRINNWQEIYEYITNYKKEKINVILDTDTYNECDDQFAVSYMLKSQDVFNIEAITVAPYSHKNHHVSIKEGQKNSYNEILKICNWLNFNTTNKVFKGATNYIQNGYNENNNAVNKIIEIALKNDKTYIMAIGAITNIALAIKKEAKIINKIEIVWLGGNDLNHKNNLEYNFRQDIKAVRIVYNSKVKLTVIPCKDVASILKTDINILKNNLSNKNELCNYLIDRFYNDGYHGIQKSRVIWDIAVIAYLINKSWFNKENVSCPIIANDTSYKLTNNRHNITFVTKIDKNRVYEDIFKKLGE